MIYFVPGFSTLSYIIKVSRLFPVAESRFQSMGGIINHSVERTEKDDESILSSTAFWTFVRSPQFLTHLWRVNVRHSCVITWTNECLFSRHSLKNFYFQKEVFLILTFVLMNTITWYLWKGRARWTAYIISICNWNCDTYMVTQSASIYSHHIVLHYVNICVQLYCWLYNIHYINQLTYTMVTLAFFSCSNNPIKIQ